MAHGEVKIDEALTLLILLSCHGKPGLVRRETRDDGTVVLHRLDLPSAFKHPFHHKRFSQVRAALLNRGRSGSHEDLRAQVMQLLVDHVPRVVASLRRNPPRGKRSSTPSRATGSSRSSRTSSGSIAATSSRPPSDGGPSSATCRTVSAVDSTSP